MLVLLARSATVRVPSVSARCHRHPPGRTGAVCRRSRTAGSVSARPSARGLAAAWLTGCPSPGDESFRERPDGTFSRSGRPALVAPHPRVAYHHRLTRDSPLRPGAEVRDLTRPFDGMPRRALLLSASSAAAADAGTLARARHRPARSSLLAQTPSARRLRHERAHLMRVLEAVMHAVRAHGRPRAAGAQRSATASAATERGPTPLRIR